MPEMIERVARAIKPGAWQVLDLYNGQIEKLDEYKRAEIFWSCSRARAAITAMREPTEAMCQQGVAGGDWPYAAETWRTMIDAALAGVE